MAQARYGPHRDAIWSNAVAKFNPELKGYSKWINKLLDGALSALGAELGRAIWRGVSGVIVGGGVASVMRWLRDYIVG